ncbi:MAG: hypothetical protein NC402_05495 [Prevotella sp.]|nr:hypothetical protein [Prevotella sp.]MCM1075241.1 hypothetical protein [Ruminococcus sp.]
MKKFARFVVLLMTLYSGILFGDENVIDSQVVTALSGGYGYGVNGECIQEPGAQAGAYVYAGTYLPYEAPSEPITVPDSLEILFVNHVGRHGSRYISSDKYTHKVRTFLADATGLSTVGKRVRLLAHAIDSLSIDKWGALDALGTREQTGIGERFAKAYFNLFHRNDSISGYASYIPRCVMSMDEMTHGIVWENRCVELSVGSGKRYSPYMRPYDCNAAYKAYKKSDEWRTVYDAFTDSICPTTVALRLTERGSEFLAKLCSDLIGRGVECAGAPLEDALADTLAGEWPKEWIEQSGMTKRKAVEVAQSLYAIVAGSQSMFMTEELPTGILDDWQNYFTEQEYARLWECRNLKHYLEFSASCFSEAPAAMAASLLEELITTLRSACNENYTGPAAIVRFGHAETLMPLFALMRLPGCYYKSRDLGSVSANWQDFNIVPMAANLQMILTRSKITGEKYLLLYRDEQPIGNPEPVISALAKLQDLLGGE